MKYYLITYSAEITLSGNRIFWSKAIKGDPVDYFIKTKEEEEKKQTLIIIKILHLIFLLK